MLIIPTVPICASLSDTMQVWAIIGLLQCVVLRGVVDGRAWVLTAFNGRYHSIFALLSSVITPFTIVCTVLYMTEHVPSASDNDYDDCMPILCL